MKKREREKKGAWYYMPLGLTPNYIKFSHGLMERQSGQRYQVNEADNLHLRC